MTGTRVIIHAATPAPLIEEIAGIHENIDFTGCDSYEGLPSLIEAVRPDALFSIRFAGTPGFPRDAIFGSSGPRWLCVGGAGVDHLGQWDPATTTVTNGAGVAADMMAEYVIGGLLHFTLDVPGLEADRAARRWICREVRPLAGKTILIVGLGHTGRAVAARAKTFGMTVVGTRARPKATPHVDEVHDSADLLELCARADVVVVCTPLLDSTRALLNEETFAAMKPGVLLVDVSRGGVIDSAALVRALDTGKVAGAALDVFETEPLPQEHPLWSMENVLISPHCSSVFDGWEFASVRIFSRNLSRFVQGETLSNVVDPARGY